jgi:hypothetical protein
LELTLNDRHAADEILALKPYDAEGKRTHELYARAEHLALRVLQAFPVYLKKPQTDGELWQLCQADVARPTTIDRTTARRILSTHNSLEAVSTAAIEAIRAYGGLAGLSPDDLIGTLMV